MANELDSDAQAVLDVLEAMGVPPFHELSVEDARARMRATFVARDEQLALESVDDLSVPTPAGLLCLRLYRPSTAVSPIALFLHGGGWTVNDVDTHDRLCRRITKLSGWMLASLDYRRAPEHKYPVALQDAYFAYRWILDNAERIGADAERRAIIGESSGGTIAASLTLLLREGNAPMPTHLSMAYPMTDVVDRWPSYQQRGAGYALDRSLMLWYMDHYLPAGWDSQDPYLFPLAASDLRGFPPTFIMTAEFDPLRDEGIAYAQKLASAGVEVRHVHVDDQMHGFLMMDRAVRKASGLIGHLANALAGPSKQA